MKHLRRSDQWLRRAIALMLLMMLTAACAGSVGKYSQGVPQGGDLGGALAEQGAIVDPETGELIDPVTGEVIQPGGQQGSLDIGTTVGGNSVAGGASADSNPSDEAAGGIGSTTGVSKDAIKIGLFYPKSGHYAGLARNTAQVVRTAFEEAGRIYGRELVLETYDDGTGNASTIQTEERRAKDEVFVYLSVISESNVILAPLANQHRVPAVIGNIDEKVALPLRYAFSVFAYWRHQATILPGFIKNELKAATKRIGIVYEGSSTAKAAKDAFKSEAKASGLNVVFEQPVATNQSSCANEVSNLQANDVELVFMMNGPLAAICMLRDARTLGYRPIWTGVGVSWNLNVVAQATGGAADGIRTLATVTTLETPEGRHYSELMRENGLGEAADEDTSLVYYSLVRSVIEALRRTGPNLGREAFVQTFETKMNGYNSGYLAPPHFAPGDRSGPQGVSVTACCNNRRWYTEQPRWRSRY